MEEFKVSVLIAVYNAEKFLANAIESAMAQEEVGEILLIEDASPDDCLKICKDFAKKYEIIKMIQHTDKKNHGAAASWNLGIKMAKCNYIAFLGADDYYLPNRFSKDKEFILSNNNIEGVYSAIAPVALDAMGSNRLHTLKRDTLVTLTTVADGLRSELLFEKMSPIGDAGHFSLNGLTVKKTVFDKTGPLDVNLRLSQDTDISLKLAAVCKLVPGILDKPVAFFGVHENNRSHNFEKIVSNRPYLFHSIYKWGISKKIDQERVFLLWQKFFEYSILVRKMNWLQKAALLTSELAKNHSLIKSKFFRIQVGNITGYHFLTGFASVSKGQ